MVKMNDIPLFSLIDVVSTLTKVDDDKAYEFAGELTGLSVDTLSELTDNIDGIYNK